MERLTKRNESNTAYYYPKCFKKCDGLGTSEACNKCELQNDTCEKLGHYEDLEEQGLLLKLPCKVGSTLWSNDFGIEVTGFSYKNLNDDEDDDDCDYGDEIVLHYRSCGGAITGKFAESEIGKTIFLTREEAEKKLEELRGTE